MAHLSRTLVAGSMLLAAASSAAPAAAQTSDGGVRAVEQPFLGAVRDSGSGGAAPASGESGGAAVGERAPVQARREARRRAARKRAAERRRRERRAPRGPSGGTRPTPPATTPVPTPGPDSDETGHRFPVGGAFDLGGEGSRFGAARGRRLHQGQDIAAAEGTPVLAPWAGVVEHVRYQRRGAGWYIVLDGDGEDRDYVFMHLRRGSILVTAGQHVSAGEQLAQVGNTGASSGPHLHFEIWVGGWYEKGGAPIDPLPLLGEWIAQ